MKPVTTSAPAKIILFGEHGVNREQPALAAAVDLRVRCELSPRVDATYTFRSGERAETVVRGEVLAFKREVDELRAAGDLDAIREQARDFWAPPRYVLGHILERYAAPGLDAAWRSEVPIGSGLGSGAAVFAALAYGAIALAGHQPDPQDVAFLAWQGDIIAHGGVASGLDSGACALGGLTHYMLEAGPRPLPLDEPLPVVIADTLVSANTAEVNTRVRRWLATHPARMHLFREMGLLAREAMPALRDGDLTRVGHLMNLNQLVLEKIGVSCPEIEHLVYAALSAGALGAKLSGSGGGGIVIALVRPGEQHTVARAIEAADGRAYVVAAGVPGARIEASHHTHEKTTRSASHDAHKETS